MKPDLLALPALGKKLLGCAVRVAYDDRHGAIQDALSGAVILFQQDNLSILIIPRKAHHIAIVGSPPAIDGLIGITHYVEVVVKRSQMLQQRVLRLVGILELIDQHVLEALGIFV